MVTKTALSTAKYFANRNFYKNDEVDIYKYGFELLFSTILNTLSIMIISLYMNIFIEGILFLFAVVSLRITAGGYHAKGHWSCFLVNNITYLIFAVLLKYLLADYLLYYTLLSVITASTIIWFLAPIEAKNKPLSDRKKAKVRTASLVIALINIILVLVFISINLTETFIAYYISGMLAASISLIAAKILYK
ncbi:MAG: accessory gene regulator B family protein [Lachnospiraceae bacterium]|nr:accessory gene regulator B family protein [Lachnospiraceae bacterium]